MKKTKITLTFTILTFMISCSSGIINVKKNENLNGTVIQKTSGKACGSKIISMPGAMALDFIPIMFNSRLQRALQEAVLSVPGAKSLKNIEIEEKWFYWLLGQTRCVIVKGDAV